MAVHKPLAERRNDGAQISAEPPLLRNRQQRLFDLHPAIFAMLGGSFFAFLAILGSATMEAPLVVPFAIFFVFLAMFFAVPAVIARVVPDSGAPRQSWKEFMAEGIETGSGALGGPAAIVQIMTLPALLVAWSVFAALYWSAIG